MQSLAHLIMNFYCNVFGHYTEITISGNLSATTWNDISCVETTEMPWLQLHVTPVGWFGALTVSQALCLISPVPDLTNIPVVEKKTIPVATFQNLLESHNSKSTHFPSSLCPHTHQYEENHFHEMTLRLINTHAVLNVSADKSKRSTGYEKAIR